jgi:N-acetylglucosamine-6-phosphate deacetylase
LLLSHALLPACRTLAAMLPTTGRTLHVHSSSLVLDATAASGSILVDADAGTVLSVDPGPDEVPADATVIDVGAHPIVPSPLDLHLHGAGGHVVPPDGDPLEVDAALQRAAARAGWLDPRGLTVGIDWLATLPIPASPPHDPLEHVAASARAIAAAKAGGCQGIRIEGMFLNPSRAGVWPPDTFQAPDPVLLEELDVAARDGGSRLLIVDVAPELSGAIELVERMGELGIVASIAHSDASWEQARRAIDAGASLATHVWNAMVPMHHREPGVVGAVLADRRVTCELICDGVHLHPGTVALSIAACGSGRWVPVSDASPFAGCEPGRYDWAGTTVTHDGVALRDDQGRLAGSASLLDEAWHRLAGHESLSMLDRALALGATPRRVLDPARTLGIQVGDHPWIVGSNWSGIDLRM